MICKYCGAALKAELSFCPKCGRPVSLEGGNGFWDIALGPGGAQAAPAAPAAPAERIVEVEKEVVRWSKVPLVIGAVLFLLGLALFGYGKLSTAKEIRTLKTEHTEELSRLAGEHAAQILALEEKLAAAEETAAQAAAEAEKPVEILHRPSSEEQELGWNDHNLFVFRVGGSALSFVWEKRDGENWVPLAFDAEGVNERYGLKLVEDLEKGESILRAVGLTAESEGDYRCTVRTAGGSASAEVSLTVLQGSDASSDEPDPDA